MLYSDSVSLHPLVLLFFEGRKEGGGRERGKALTGNDACFSLDCVCIYCMYACVLVYRSVAGFVPLFVFADYALLLFLTQQSFYPSSSRSPCDSGTRHRWSSRYRSWRRCRNRAR